MAKKKKWYPSEDILSFIKEKEGFIPRSTIPQGDSVWTVGYGFTDKDIVRTYMDKDMTKEEADAVLATMVDRRLQPFERSTPNFDKLNNNQRDALFSYFYNTGEDNFRNKSPKLQQALKDLNHEEIMAQMDADYNDRVQKGAKPRRDQERAFYATPYGIPYRRAEEYEHPLEDNININVMPDGGKVAYPVNDNIKVGKPYYTMDILRKSLADRVTPNSEVDIWGARHKFQEYTGIVPKDVPVDEYSQNLWQHFLGQPSNIEHQGDESRMPKEVVSVIEKAFNGGLEKELKKKKKTLKSFSGSDEDRTILEGKVKWLEDTIERVGKAREGEWTPFNEYDFFVDNEGGITPLSGLGNFGIARDERGNVHVTDKYDFYNKDQDLAVKMATSTLDAIGYPFKIEGVFQDKPDTIPGEKQIIRKATSTKNILDEKHEFDFGGTTQSEAQDYIYNKLVDEYNFTPVQAVGIVANLTYESGLNPTIVRKGGKDFGLQQWVGDRRKGLYAYAKQKGHDIPTFDDQLEYVVKEYRGNENNGWTHINKGSNLYKKDPEKFKDFDYYQYSKAEFDNSNTISDAVVSWNQGFGRPPKEYLATDRRIKIGKDLATRYGIEDKGDSRYQEGSVGGANALPEIEVAQARLEGKQAGVQPIAPAPTSFSYGSRPELQSDIDRWMQDYGKDLAAQLLNTNTLLNKTADLLDRNKDQKKLDNEKTSEQIKQAEQDQQLRSFIRELIPSMQMKYKGVAK